MRNILFGEILTCFHKKKLLFPVTTLNFLYSGVLIRQIYKADSGITLSIVIRNT